MNAAEVAAEIHSLIMEHGLVVDGMGLLGAVETSEYDTTGEVSLQFSNGSEYEVIVRAPA